MPRKTKDTSKIEEKKVEKKAKATTKKTTAKKVTAKKAAPKKEPAAKKKDTKKVATKTSKIKATTKKVASTKKAVVSEPKKAVSKSKASKTTATTKKVVEAPKKTTAKTTTKATAKTTKKPATKSKKSTTVTKKKTTSRKKIKLDTPVLAEYYDLPYSYNQTVVKILYQTPKILFVYWEISEQDRLNFINQYGENFFNETKPILKIHNITLNYSFEIEINDFANSWYLNINDANCEYVIELGRRPLYEDKYIYVASSNGLETPNDHILFEKLPSKLQFKNMKTNEIYYRDIGSIKLIAINKLFSIYDFYKMIYKDEILEELNNNKIINPSSSSFSF